jgi:hypothetical protein
VIGPQQLRRRLARAGSHWCDGTQQDLHEFLACFLDYLHEDVNRAAIVKKPQGPGKGGTHKAGPGPGLGAGAGSSSTGDSTSAVAGAAMEGVRGVTGGAGSSAGVDRNPGEDSGDEGFDLGEEGEEDLEGEAGPGAKDDAAAAAVAWCRHLQRNKSVMGGWRGGTASSPVGLHACYRGGLQCV